RSGNAWRSGGTLKLADAAAGTRFGTSLATDGSTLLVGMRRGSSADSARGGVQVCTRGANGAWTDAGSLGGAPMARSTFGAAVAIAGDWAFVGAPGGSSGGSVHVFRRTGGRWVDAGTLASADINAGDRFGS